MSEKTTFKPREGGTHQAPAPAKPKPDPEKVK